MYNYITAAGRFAGIAWIALIGTATCAIILYVAVVLLAPSGDPWKTADCDRGSEIQPAGSPSGAWLARGIFLQCGGPLASTAVNYIVIVKNGREPTRDSEVFSGDWGYENVVGLTWKDDKLLQITLPDDALIYQQREKLGDITVQIKFQSDDPRVRETALRKREQRVKETLSR